MDSKVKWYHTQIQWTTRYCIIVLFCIVHGIWFFFHAVSPGVPTCLPVQLNSQTFCPPGAANPRMHCFEESSAPMAGYSSPNQASQQLSGGSSYKYPGSCDAFYIGTKLTRSSPAKVCTSAWHDTILPCWPQGFRVKHKFLSMFTGPQCLMSDGNCSQRWCPSHKTAGGSSSAPR